MLSQHGRRPLEYENNESLEHVFWKYQISSFFQGLGFKTFIEDDYTDVVLRISSLDIAAEVETGKSNWAKNVAKNKKRGRHEIFVFATNEDAYYRISAHYESDDQVTVFSAKHLTHEVIVPFLMKRFHVCPKLMLNMVAG